MVAFTFNAILVSKTFKREFLSTHQARGLSAELQKILHGLPEGVMIMDQAGDNLKFINSKLKKSFNIFSFHDMKHKIDHLQNLKKAMDEEFDSVYQKVIMDPFKSSNSEDFTSNVLNKFKVTVKDGIEESKDSGSVLDVGKYQNLHLNCFLSKERELCMQTSENQRSTKIKISHSSLNSEEEPGHLQRDFIVKTSKIAVTDENEKNPTFLQMFIDTTQITMLEEAKAQSSYQRQMLSNVSHEFRTPLNAMCLSLQLMKKEVQGDLKKYHSIASSSCDILSALVEDILDFSKIEAGVFEIEQTVFKFQDLFEEVHGIFEMQAQRKRIRLNFEIEDLFVNLQIKTDKKRLKQVLMNLISNALKFTDRGSINIELRVKSIGRYMVKDSLLDRNHEGKLIRSNYRLINDPKSE